MKNFVVLVLGVTMIFGCSTQPKRETATSPLPTFYHRFYQGYRLESVTPVAYEEKINKKFLPLFPLAHPLGLHAYRPVLPKMVKGCDLPAEVALLTFNSEPEYQAYRETEIGKQIRDAHTVVFDSNKSKSLVPKAYDGKVEPGQAYKRNALFENFQSAASALVIACSPKANKDFAAAITEMYSMESAADEIIFSPAVAHAVEYVFVNDFSTLEIVLSERRSRLAKLYGNVQVIPLEKMKIGSKRVKASQGLDAQW